jgi:hypothetical protein
MSTLHIENTVDDYDAWKAAFDKFDRVRRDNGVLGHRITRAAADPRRVYVDLDFAGRDEALAFVAVLEKIWRTPQSHAVLANHRAPEVRDVAESSTVVGAG